MILVQNPGFHNQMGLDVHVRTKIRYGYSYIESAAIRFGEDIFEVSSFGEYSINGVDEAKTPFMLAGKFRLDHPDQVNEKERNFKIHLDNRSEEYVVVKTFKDMVNVKFWNASHTNFASSIGLMGTFSTNQLLGRDRKTVIQDLNEFGQEWQVRADEAKLFEIRDSYPQHPESCVLPTLGQSSSSHEKTVSPEEAQVACGHWHADMVEVCIKDVLATNDIEVAHAHSAFF